MKLSEFDKDTLSSLDDLFSDLREAHKKKENNENDEDDLDEDDEDEDF